jgi:hypothetical protein
MYVLILYAYLFQYSLIAYDDVTGCVVHGKLGFLLDGDREG